MKPRTACLVLFSIASILVQISAQTVVPHWTDPSPHKVVMIRNKGVALESLDWGGRGEVMLLLAGLGSSAHIYDNFAVRFTYRFRVVALTRRGLGQSDTPENGYDMLTLVDDIRQCMDALGINRAVVVGHSFGAAEAAVFARTYPDRVIKVVYLDGAYEPSPERNDLMRTVGRLMPSPTPEQAQTLDTLLEWLRTSQPGWNSACEADLRNMMLLDPAGGTSRPPSPAFRLLMETATTTSPEFQKVTMPSLALFADDQVEKLKAGLDSKADREALNRLGAFHHRAAEHFRQTVKNGTVIERPDTVHDCFVQREAEVVRDILDFLK